MDPRVRDGRRCRIHLDADTVVVADSAAENLHVACVNEKRGVAIGAADEAHLAAGIAHEIRNPLTSLQLFVQLMPVKFDDHEFRQKFSDIVPPELERLNRIVNDLVSFSKPSKITTETMPVSEILDQGIRLSEMSIKKSKIKIERDYVATPKVNVDKQKMMQIFLNLFMNAAQAMPEGGIITIKTYVNPITNRAAIDVADSLKIGRAHV